MPEVHRVGQKKMINWNMRKSRCRTERFWFPFFGATAETEANRMKNEVSGLFPDAWVFKSKSAR